MRTYQLFINGSFVNAADGRTFESINPFNGEVVATVARAGAEDARRAVAAARAAFDQGPWPAMPLAERSAFLKKLVDAINARQLDLVALEVADSGTTIRKAKEDVALSARNLNYFAKMAAQPLESEIEGLSKPGFSKNLLCWEPVGVVAGIIPWNFPLKMAIWKLGPALAAGNTVVLKPSELTPATAMELAQMVADAGFPPGVVNIIPGYGAEAGEALVRDRQVDKVSFTGSTAVGRKIMSMASETLKKITLECGGKSANIVLDDADLELAVDGALYAIFYHQGQCCEAGSRLLLPLSLHDSFVERLVEKVRRMTIGDPTNPVTEIGPLISQHQRERVLGYIQSGKQEGASLAVGGSTPSGTELSKGFFVEPTIFTGVSNNMKIAREEIFGPVLSVIPYATEDEAVAIANDSPYGLAGGIWSADKERALRIARRLRTGTVWINEWHLISEKAPFGGYKQSGVGREFGMEGIKEYTEAKHLHIDEIGVRSKKFWYDTVVPK
ncbi:MAG: aldehyde dehydrogenase family protein [Bacteroidota bacterium]